MAIDFIQNLCRITQSNRYDVATALKHPFITRDLTAEIPKDQNSVLMMKVEKE